MARNTQRQPSCSVTVPDTSGPTIDGTTQDAAKAAITEGRSRSGYARPTTTYSATITSPPPSPCTARPSTNSHIDRRGPADHQPGREAADARGQRRAAARCRSHHWPLTTIASSDVVKYAGEGEGVQPEAVQLPRRDRHGRADGGRLEGDQQHHGDDPEGQRPVRPPQHAVLGRASVGVPGCSAASSRLCHSHPAQRKGQSPPFTPAGGPVPGLRPCRPTSTRAAAS